MVIEILDSIIKRGIFPTCVNNKVGEELKKYFLPVEKSGNQSGLKELKKRYSIDYRGYKYILLEEFLLDEEEHVIDYKKIIGKNFYLNRKKNLCIDENSTN